MTTTQTTRTRKPRITHVECTTSSGWRWLKGNVRGATQLPDGRFQVSNESDWSMSLQAAGGREVK